MEACSSVIISQTFNKRCRIVGNESKVSRRPEDRVLTIIAVDRKSHVSMRQNNDLAYM